MRKVTATDSRTHFEYDARTEPRPSRYPEKKTRDRERRRDRPEHVRQPYVEDESSSMEERRRIERIRKKASQKQYRGEEDICANRDDHRGSADATMKPKLQRTNSSSSMNYTMKKMHHSMGSDYGGSEDEGYYRSRPRNRSRATSRQRSHSRNRVHSDAYAPPGHTNFVDVRDIVSDVRTEAISYEPRLHRSNSSPFLSRAATKECFCCSEDFQSMRTLPLQCGHCWCSSCLSRLVQLAVDHTEFWPPKCCSIEILGTIIRNNLAESTYVKYQTTLDKQPIPSFKRTKCPETFSNPRLVLCHLEKIHPGSKDSPPENIKEPETVVTTEEASNPKENESDISGDSSSARTSEESSPSTTITEPDPDPDSDKEILRSSTPPSPALISKLVFKKTHRQWKYHQLPSIVIIFLGKKTAHFLGFRTTAWFVLVLAAVATAITTTYSVQGPLPDPSPQIGDSNYYSLLSQSIIAVCSLYYLMVPYLRGEEQLPVRALFYICWTLSLAGTITAPLIYAREWTKSVWAGYSGALAQVAATAFLFEHVGRERKEREETQRKAVFTDDFEEDEVVEKHTDATERDT
ncbi:hypothetical protein F5884DRAFT_903973 [Xylogone sp. PMI_703]|nr:hypothetical protein F5884DRAFT_903973 [Xylogone sp. PMI_703]